MTTDSVTNTLPIGEFPLEEGKRRDWIWGELHLQTFLKNNQLWVRNVFLDSESETVVPKEYEFGDELDDDEDTEWIRWPLEMPINSLKISAITPDLPFVIKSKNSIYLQPGQSVNILVSVPSWLKLTAKSGNDELELHEFSTVPLQKTWFGTPLDGELCYWRETRALMGSAPNNTNTNNIQCPLMIRNNSDEILNFRQFNFRVEELTIFKEAEQLWGDETRIDFKGQALTSDITNTGKLPKYLGIKNPELISKPRKHARKSITRRTFNFFLNK